MHYYPEDQSKENLEKIRDNNVCPECGRQLYAYLDSEKKVYIACSGQVHEGIAREYEPQPTDYRSNIRREAEMERREGQKTTKALAHVPKQGQLSQPQAETILKLLYPNATSDERLRTAIFCRDFGLHPLANEVYLIPFKGKNVMVVGIPASRKMAHALKGEFSFLDDTPRAASDEEIVKQYGKDSEEAKINIISVTKLQGEGGNLAIGFGLWPKSEKPYGMDKGNTPRNMSNIRSERQAMDRLPGKAMPHFEVVDTAFVEGADEVDKRTGEIIDGDFKEVPPEAPEGKDGTEEEVEAKKKERAKRKPKTEPPPAPEGMTIDQDWLLEAVNKTKMHIPQYIKDSFKVEPTGDTLFEVVGNLTEEQQDELKRELEDRLAML